MKIKKEALTVKPTSLGGCEEILNDSLLKKIECSMQSTTIVEDDSDKSLSVLSHSNQNSLQETVSSGSEPWHHGGILHQALMQVSSRHTGKPVSSINETTALSKMTDSHPSSAGDIKLSQGLSAAPLTSATFPADRSFPSAVTSLPSVTSHFGSLSFATLPAVSLTPSTLPLSTQLQSGLSDTRSTPPTIPAVSNVSGSSSVSVASSDISTSLIPVPQLCQAIASLSKDDAVTVVYSSVPKIEPLGSHLIHNKTAPLPSMSEVKSSLSNHLNAKPAETLNNKTSLPAPIISSTKLNPHGKNLGFSNIPESDVVEAVSTIKLDGNSEFVGNSALSSDSSSSDLASSIVIPVSSDVILTKIDGQNNCSSQDIGHIITIPLANGTVYNSSLIPMSLPLCNGNPTATSTVVPNLPYPIASISGQGANTCWPTSAVALSVISNSHQATPVTASLPATSSSGSIPSPSLATSAMAQDPVCYTVQSPAEILSQLSKAGALPAMSSSQVSSVLSALGTTDMAVDMEHEILNNQVLHADRVSALTQTDSLEMTIMQNDEKIVQFLGGQQLLEQVILPSQSQPIPSGAPRVVSTIHQNDLVPEPKQPSVSHPRIVAMVLNTSIMGNDVQRLQGTVFKDTEFQITNNIEEPHSEQLAESCSESLRNYLVLPNSEKPQRKRTKRTSALREMLLGMSESSDDKEGQSKKLRGRARKSKSLEDVPWKGNGVTLGFSKEAECYKCGYCPFLSLDENNMVVHVKLKHSCEVPDASVVRHELKCPGCPNVFFSTDSLEVHLKQDHQVHSPELEAITSSAIKTAAKKKDGERKKNLDNSVNHPSPICLPETYGENMNDVSVVGMTGSLVMSVHNDIPEVTLSERNSIQVRNLSNKVELSTSQTSSKEEKSTDNGSLDTHGLHAAKGSDEVIFLEGAGEKSTGSETVGEQKRKRGRPKGSRSTVQGKDDKIKRKASGHRCGIDNCAVTLRSPANIEYHRKCHKGAEFQCPECPHTHCHWDGMSIHLWRTHMVDMELLTCDQCNYKTNSYAKMINLHKWIHGSERPFLCDLCGKGFKNRKQLRNHKAVHQPKQVKVGECEVCGRAFSNKRLLRMHLDNVHNKLRPHLCNYCGYSASSVSSLKMHMRKHTGEKPFRCQLCDYCTADHNSLRRHKMRHTGDKPYKCPHCPYACIQSSTYKAHLKTKHPGMDGGLMFSCNLCSFRSVKEENYIAHVAEHKPDVGPISENQNIAEEQVPAAAVGAAAQMPLFSNNERAVEEQFDLAPQSSGNESPEHFSVMKQLGTMAMGTMDSTSDVQMALESEFEGEVITGDLPGDLPSDSELITGDLNEPEEFKVCASELKVKSHQETNSL